MIRNTVSSSNISSVGYDNTSQTLEIEFKKGDVYHFINVPFNIYSGLMSASSHGIYFDRNIKGIYNYNKID
ncbi:KTSC domain-containing protein [uncultured Mucilaginibacter sp.]|uniref:KTSC domain-containing protein n=1 Tax=uncultured Mucilaginibacter sp. TaxID=797541 RepID=UPI002607FA7A|nr:KTSC domain-containing protein [uncultured Mucilaginibacter sp.]